MSEEPDFVGHGAAHRAAEFSAKWLAPILFIVLIPVFAIGYVYDHNGRLRQYESNVAACERGNVLRARINDRDERYRAVFQESSEILTAQGTTPAAAAFADALRRAAEEVAPIPLVPDCEEAFDKPMWFWQTTREEK